MAGNPDLANPCRPPANTLFLLQYGVELNYDYDAAQRLTDIYTNDGERIQYDLDSFGNQKGETIYNASLEVRRLHNQEFNDLGRLWQSIGINTQITQVYSYDENNNLNSIVDYNLREIIQSFDPLDRLGSVTDRELGVIDYAYDGQDNLISVQDQDNLETTYTVDGFGRRIRTVSPDTGTTDYYYDLADNLTSKIDARNVNVMYTYDAAKRLLTVTYPASPLLNVDYTYDEVGTQSEPNYGVGRLTKIEQANGTQLQYFYNAQGLVYKEVREISGQSYSTQYGYDDAGILNQIVYPSGREVGYLFDDNGRVETIRTRTLPTEPWLTLIDTIRYEPFGPISSFDYGNGLQQSNQYDLHYRPDIFTVLDGSIPLYQKDVGFNLNDELESINDLLDPNQSQLFAYDGNLRLEQAIGSYGQFDYGYDGVGNRETRERTNSPESFLENYVYPLDSHRLSTVSSVASLNLSMSYSDTGNITGDGIFTYGYDDRNRLVSVTQNSSPIATYDYNPLGERIIKTSSSLTQHFVYGPQSRLLGEYSASGDAEKEYVYLNDILVAVLEPSDFQGVWTTTTDEVVQQQGINYRKAYSGDGSGATLYTEYNDSLSQYELKIQTFDAQGVYSSEVILASSSTNYINNYTLYRNDLGDMVVIWMTGTSQAEYNYFDHSTQQWAAQTTALGSMNNFVGALTPGGKFLLISGASTQQATEYTPAGGWSSPISLGAYWVPSAIKVDDQGNAYTVDYDYTDEDDDRYYLHVYRYSSTTGWNTTPIHTETLNGSNTFFTGKNFTVDSNGDLLLTWGIGNSYRSVYSRFYDNSAQTWSNKSPLENLGGDAYPYQVSLVNGRGVVGINYEVSSSIKNIYTNRFDATTISWAGLELVVDDAAGHLAIDLSSSGDIYLTWLDRAGYETSVKSIQYDQALGAWGQETLIQLPGTGTYWPPEQQILDSGDVVVNWSTSTNPPEGSYVLDVSETGSLPYYVHNDYLGTPQRLTDSNRSIVWEAETLPFGETNIVSSQIEFNVRFPGQYYDEETGLHYNLMRYYHPGLGRYVQSDPIELFGGINSYTYVSNNPLIKTDSWGLLEDFTFKLNGENTSKLKCECGKSFDAFSGHQEARNNKNFVDFPGNGPIPPGLYYIVNRPSGGVWGSFLSWISGKDQWFALYRDDGSIGDSTLINGVYRDKFRLHPGTLSLGCITLNKSQFSKLRELLNNTDISTIPNTDIDYYGTITVE